MKRGFYQENLQKGLLIYMIFLSSNEQRKRKVKDICKKYNDLPPNIVKQIVEYELSKDKKINLRRSISDIKVINERISKYEEAINVVLKGKAVINNPYAYEFPVIIDLGNGYCTRMTVMEAIEKIKSLYKTKRNIIAGARYEYAIKEYVNEIK